jgi:hypothetical protein
MQNLDPPTEDKIIVSLVERKNENKKSTTTYSFYHPETGEKIDADTICKGEEIVVQESLLSQLDNSDVDLNSVFFLTKQDINIFNLSDEFYTDICYHFDSPNGRDAPLSVRMKAYYPNITLCDPGCTNKGVNLTTLESICQCAFNDLMSNELIVDNALIQSAIGEIFDIIKNSNLVILQCYKDLFKIEYFIKGIGGFIVISIMIVELVFSMIFFSYDMALIRSYLYHLTQYFLMYFNNINNIEYFRIYFFNNYW